MFFSLCVICGVGTLFAYVRHIIVKGHDTGYDYYQCSKCNKIGSARPRK